MSTAQSPAPAPRPPAPRSKQLADKLSADVLASAKEAKKKGKFAWTTPLFPHEILEGLGIEYMYPESMSAGVAARHKAMPYLEHAEGPLAYAPDVCSYVKISLSLTDLLQDPSFSEFDYPLPDFLCLCNGSCGQATKWFENIAQMLGVPLVMFDSPYGFDGLEMEAHKADYLEAQMKSAIAELEALTGETMDQARFLKAQETTMKNRDLFAAIIETFKEVPSPTSGFDLYNFIGVMITCRGKEGATGVFSALLDEINERRANGTSSFRGEERHRIYWNGIACWPYLSHNMKTMKDSGMNFVSAGYVRSWNMSYTPGNLREIACSYNNTMSSNVSVPVAAGRVAGFIRDFHCDGMICHYNRSCKMSAINTMCSQHLLDKMQPVPYVFFDGDQSDPRVYSQAQFETRVQALGEVMSEGKEGRV